LLAHVWENDVDLTDWWMSEKLDGVRAYWDGSRFLSRLGNEFHAPDWFAAGLPQVPLDGELWLGRKAFQRTVSIVRRQDKSDHWREVRYVVFDAPALQAPFEERLKYVDECVHDVGSDYVQAHEHARCLGLDHLREELARVESLGGEGLMLRQPGSRYEAGRSASLLKVKTFHDAEGVVVDHVAGKGRHKGRLGALVVRMPDGTEFSVGTGFRDRERADPPPVGSTITFRYQELSDGGVPRFPSFVRVLAGAAGGNAAAAVPARKSRASQGETQRHGGHGESQTSDVGSVREAHSAAASAGKRHFEFVVGKSSKFWEIAVEGTSVTVRFGRIGTNGQTQTKTFGDAAAAGAHAEKLIGEKTEKGYVEKA
jgi:DNA ligase-1